MRRRPGVRFIKRSLYTARKGNIDRVTLGEPFGEAKEQGDKGS